MTSARSPPKYILAIVVYMKLHKADIRIHPVSTGNNSICGLAQYYIFLILQSQQYLKPEPWLETEKKMWFAVVWFHSLQKFVPSK